MNKFPIIYLHIGTHKTGSTCIQKALELSQTRLMEERILYVPQPHFYFSGLPVKEEYDNKLAKEIHHEILDIVKSKRTAEKIVFSFERLSGNENTGYTNAQYIASILKDAFKNYDTRVIIYLRRQDDFIESMYTQLIHQGGSLSFDEYFASLKEGYFDWYKLVMSYVNAFGHKNIYPQVYHKSLLEENGGILYNFSNLIGSSYLSGIKIKGKQPNVGYSREAVEIAFRLNNYLGKDSKKKLRKYLQDKYSKGYKQKYSYLSEEGRKNLMKDYEKSNQLLFNLFIDRMNSSSFPNYQHDNYEINLSVDRVIDILGPFIGKELPLNDRVYRFTNKLKTYLKTIMRG